MFFKTIIIMSLTKEIIEQERQQVQKALTVNPEKLNQTGNGDAPDFVLDRSLASPLMWIIYIVSNLCESLQ